MDIDLCQLIFLSGCEMAVNKDILLKEEGLHIAGALQMAGVPNTVATWWKILDVTAVDIATEFYKGLRRSGDESAGLDVRQSARSLNDTMLKMRSRGMSSLIWGAYVHFGP